jgi:hypothetical protein
MCHNQLGIGPKFLAYVSSCESNFSPERERGGMAVRLGYTVFALRRVKKTNHAVPIHRVTYSLLAHTKAYSPVTKWCDG